MGVDRHMVKRCKASLAGLLNPKAKDTQIRHRQVYRYDHLTVFIPCQVWAMLLGNQWPLVHTEDCKRVLVGWLSKAWELKGKLDDHLLSWNFSDTPYHYLWPECIMPWQWTPLLHFSDFMTNPANLYQCGVKASLNPSLVNRRRHGCHRTWVTVLTMDGAMLTM